MNLSLDSGGEDVQVVHYILITNHPLTHEPFQGRYAADASVWIAIVTMLATLDFNLTKDTDGNDIPFKATFTHSGVMYVEIFPVSFWYIPNKELFQTPTSVPLSAHLSPARLQRNA